MKKTGKQKAKMPLEKYEGNNELEIFEGETTWDALSRSMNVGDLSENTTTSDFANPNVDYLQNQTIYDFDANEKEEEKPNNKLKDFIEKYIHPKKKKYKANLTLLSEREKKKLFGSNKSKEQENNLSASINPSLLSEETYSNNINDEEISTTESISKTGKEDRIERKKENRLEKKLKKRKKKNLRIDKKMAKTPDSSIFHEVKYTIEQTKRTQSVNIILKELFPYGYSNEKIEKVIKLNNLNVTPNQDLPLGTILEIPLTPEDKALFKERMNQYREEKPLSAKEEFKQIHKQIKDRKDIKIKTEYVANTSKKEFLNESFENIDILHLTTHGEAGYNYNNVQKDSVILDYFGLKGDKRGVISADEFRQLDLKDLKLVFFAACETALDNSEKEKSSANYLTFAIAALDAGAWNSIAQLWKISDTAAVTFSSIFYKNLAQSTDLDLASILRNSQLEMKNITNDNGVKIYESPYFWGSQQLLSKDYKKETYEISNKNDKELNNLKNNLKSGEAVVEMTMQDNSNYVCKILKRDSDIQNIKTIPISGDRPLDQYMKAVSHLINKSSAEDFKILTIENNIYSVLWGAIQNYLDENKINRIYFIPDGVYKQSNMGLLYIPGPNSDPLKGKFVIDVLTIIQLY